LNIRCIDSTPLIPIFSFVIRPIKVGQARRASQPARQAKGGLDWSFQPAKVVGQRRASPPWLANPFFLNLKIKNNNINNFLYYINKFIYKKHL